jgi:hypothetical protein
MTLFDGCVRLSAAWKLLTVSEVIAKPFGAEVPKISEICRIDELQSRIK